MVHKLLILEWLYKADQDFGFAKYALEDMQTGYYDAVCLFLHQASEKYLKAYIVKNELKFEKQHDLLRLLKICQEHDVSLEILIDECQLLNPFYQELRYAEPVFRKATKEEALKALEAAGKIQIEMRGHLDINHEISLDELKKEDAKIDEKLKSKQ